MAVLQCGGCERFISVSVVPGGNPVALADPQRWSLTRRVCPSCARSLCDRCAPASASRCPLCQAALAAAGGAPVDEEDDSEGQVARTDLVEARRWLAAALLGAIVATVGVFGRGGTASVLATVLGLVFYAVGGWNGVERLRRAGAASPLWKALVVIGLPIPSVGAFPLAWLLWRSHAKLATLDAELQRARVAAAARERARRRAEANAEAGTRPAPAPAVPQAAARGSVLQATASIKLAGLQDVRDGEVLKVKLPARQPPVPEDQHPVLMAWKGFGVFFLVDDGNRYHYASHAEMAQAGLTPQTLLETGLRNLVRRVNGQPGLKVAPNGAIHALLMGGDFEASLLLLDELWDGPLKQHAPGGFVVALPARDICAFADARSQEGIAELRELAAKVSARGDHTLTQTLYERRNGRWLPLS